MIENIGNRIKTLSEKYPEWEQIIGQYYAGQAISDENEGAVTGFIETIITSCDAVKKEICDINAAAELFSDGLKPLVKKDLQCRLRPYYDCAVIRKNEKTCKAQLEFFIDELWHQKIIRRNPEYKIDEERCKILAVSSEELEGFTITFSAIVDHCVSRLLNYDGMVSVICNQTGISQEFSAYIARKIEKDNETLRTNFIIKSLLRLSNTK